MNLATIEKYFPDIILALNQAIGSNQYKNLNQFTYQRLDHLRRKFNTEGETAFLTKQDINNALNYDANRQAKRDRV